MISAIAKPAASVPVYRARDFLVMHGANEGDELSFAHELVPDDVYWFAKSAEPIRLSMESVGERILVGADTTIGAPGADLHLDSCLTFMSPDGRTTEVLVLVETDAQGDVNQVYGLPLATLSHGVDYTLVGIDSHNAQRRFAEVACVSFMRGTRITMASGAQKPIEALNPGDRVLTRDDGAQEIRWIGQSTVRAVGDFAPIVIKAGTLNNLGDLVVSPDHRLFVYQREDRLGTGHKEVLVRARHLLNGDTIVQQDGGFVEYYQILFDSHQIIYAEGIAAETLLVDNRTRAALPPELEQTLAANLPHQGDIAQLRHEVAPALLDRPDAADLLRGASLRLRQG
ncbi:Hint domain-containing protein [Pseudooceanicola aestuarii]|uniref:Hint domain-containing protein n=1 Tax=Pseudooceanicola aestuarii TaxID=2697319 RepID=UPI0013D5F859|nr:Hint domain-containing protein [Pseudooceanicola aestuarii]